MVPTLHQELKSVLLRQAVIRPEMADKGFLDEHDWVRLLRAATVLRENAAQVFKEVIEEIIRKAENAK